MVNVYSFFAEQERQMASQRSRDAAYKRAAEGRSCGGRIYGYNNVWVLADGSTRVALAGEQKPDGSRTTYAINEAQADTVRKIFQMYADGIGQRCAR